MGTDDPRWDTPTQLAALHAPELDLGTSFGAPTELEVELARLICEAIPSVELVRMVNSGTEATMSAAARGARLHRARQGRQSAHRLLPRPRRPRSWRPPAAACSPWRCPTAPASRPPTTADTILVEYNYAAALAEVFAAHGAEIACVIVEPVAGNMGLCRRSPDSYKPAQRLCSEPGALLIFDEVITGFRVAWAARRSFTGSRPI